MGNHEYEISRGQEYNGIPVVGDLGLFKVIRIGSHTRIINTDSKKLRIYEGDLLVAFWQQIRNRGF